MSDLKKMTISVAKCTGNANNRTYPDIVVINASEALAEVCKHDHMLGRFKNNIRRDENFINTDCLFMDCDNTGTDNPGEWLIPEMVANRLPGVAFYAVTSRHHNQFKHKGEEGESSPRPRHHYYFPLLTEIDSGDIIRNLKGSLLNIFPQMDVGAKALSQFSYGHGNPVVEYFPGSADVASFIMEHQKPKGKEKTKPSHQLNQMQTQPDFINATLRLILDAIPADDEKTWSEVAVCLYKMGNCSDQYFDDFDIYSQKSGKYKDTQDCYKKWKAKQRQTNNSPHLNFLYLIRLAEDYDITIKDKLSEIGKELSKQKNLSLQIDPETGEIIEIIKNYDDVEIKETEYLFFPWFPRGKLTAVQGDSGSSKSTFLYAVGAKVTTGSDLLGVACENPGNVLFITNEDDESDILTSFRDSGGNQNRLFRMTRNAIAQLDLSEEGKQILRDAIEKYDIKLIVLDPIQAFLRGDMNKANDTRPQLNRLLDIAEEYNMTIVFIQHTGKDTTKGALHRGIGSVDIGAATRSMLQIVTDPDDENYRIMYTVKNNTASLQDVRQAIRYEVKDHPDSYDKKSGKHRHFHGHAELVELIPEYSEQTYKKAVRKSQEREEQAIQMAIDYQADPLVITARKLVAQNPNGLFIGCDDLIKRITETKGHCPYTQSKSKANGLNYRISAIRNAMMEQDAIQMDLQDNAIHPKPYNWNGDIYSPESRCRVRGVYITPIKNGKHDSQQTEV